jgi:hypothetical protein
LLLNGSFSFEKGLPLNRNQTVQQLVKQGQILETDGKLFLSDEGKIVAEGALQVFPELSEMNRHASICSE